MATPTTPTIPGYTYGDADLPPSPVGPDARQAAWYKAVTVSVALWARAYRPDLW